MVEMLQKILMLIIEYGKSLLYVKSEILENYTIILCENSETIFFSVDRIVLAFLTAFFLGMIFIYIVDKASEDSRNNVMNKMIYTDDWYESKGIYLIYFFIITFICLLTQHIA